MNRLIRYLPLVDKQNISPRLLIFSILFLFLLFVLFFSNISFFFNPKTPISIHVSNFGVWFVILFFFLYCDRESRLTISTNIIVGIALVVLFASFSDTGGIFSIDKVWVIFLICTAFLFAGVVSGIIYTLISIVGFSIYYYLENTKIWTHRHDLPILDSDYVFITLISTIVVLGFVLFSFVRTLTLLQNKNEELVKLKIGDLNTMIDTKTEQINNLRTDIAQDFHDEMGNKLASIRLLSENLGVKSEKQILEIEDLMQTLQIIEKNAKELFDGTKDFIWTVSTKSDSIAAFFEYVREFADLFLNDLDINLVSTYRIKKDDDFKIDPICSRQLIFVIKEIITNSAKHSKAKQVDLQFDNTDNTLQIVVKDDGIGFDVTKPKSRGLKNIEHRLQRINANYTCFSTHDGTLFQINFPLN